MTMIKSMSPRRRRGAFLAIVVLVGTAFACARSSSSQADSSGPPAAGVSSEAAREADRPADAVPPPEVDAARIAFGSGTYETTFTIDGEERRVTTRRELERVGKDGGLVRLREITVGTPGRGETITDLAGETLRFRKRVTRQPNASADIEYAGDRVTGLIRMGEREFPVHVELDAPAFGEGAALETAILGLPLAEGYRTSLRSAETGLLQRVRRWSLAVAGSETLEIPAGSFATYRVELEPADDAGGGKTLWVTRQAPRLLVRVENRLPPELGGTFTTTTRVTAP